MTLADRLETAGYTQEAIETSAKVHLEKVEGGFAIGRIDLTTTAVVPNIEPDAFQQQAEAAKSGCPISKALAAVDIRLDATLKS
jgi:lipoyl-dependent peroxiredoxin